MPRLSKATVFDKWIDTFSDMPLEDQAFALAQVQAIHRQTQRQKERIIPLKVADLPFDDVKVTGKRVEYFKKNDDKPPS
jgi:hypothetical protein